MWHNRAMKARLTVCTIAALAAASPALSDTLTYRDGRIIRCVIEEETAAAVTITLHGQRVEVPRSMISSTARSSAGENRALRDAWASRRAAYRDQRPAAVDEEVAGAAQAAPPTPTPAAASGPPPPPVAVRGVAAAGHPPKPPPPDRTRDLRWRKEVKDAIREKRVLIGMTEREVNSAWGSPERTHPVHGSTSSSDRWTYRRRGEGLVDLYFRDGILTQISR